MMSTFSFVIHESLENFRATDAYKLHTSQRKEKIYLKDWMSEAHVQYVAGACIRGARKKLLFKGQKKREQLEHILGEFVETDTCNSSLNAVIRSREIVKGKLLVPKIAVHIFFKRLWLFIGSKMPDFWVWKTQHIPVMQRIHCAFRWVKNALHHNLHIPCPNPSMASTLVQVIRERHIYTSGCSKQSAIIST